MCKHSDHWEESSDVFQGGELHGWATVTFGFTQDEEPIKLIIQETGVWVDTI
jgi:hypothetical protein